MRFDEMTPAEKITYKRQTLHDFMEHGMSEKEALVNYVFCVNPDPLAWLEHKYKMSPEEAESLKVSGLGTYERNGGSRYGDGIEKASPKKKTCNCRRPILPE
jgi:hypothetical protein